MSTNFPAALDNYITIVDNVDDVLAAHPNDRGDAIEALEAKIGVDNSSVNTSFDYYWKHPSGRFRMHNHSGESDDGAKIPIANISDMSVSNPQDGQALKYNSATGKWENGNISSTVTGLTDTDISSPADYDALVYQSASGKWENKVPRAVYSS